MFPQPTLRPSTTFADRPVDAAYYRAILHELIDLGADLARTVHAGAKASADLAADPTIPFDRIARCVRRTILLARSLDQPPPAQTHRHAARRRIIREVEDAIHRRGHPDDAPALHAELLERLDGPDLDDDLDDRPAAAIIADLCRDLGLDPAPGARPWKRRTPADIVTLWARAARPGRNPQMHGSAMPPGAADG